MGLCNGYFCRGGKQAAGIYNYHPKYYSHVQKLGLSSRNCRGNGAAAILCLKCIQYESPWAKLDIDFTSFKGIPRDAFEKAYMCVDCPSNGTYRCAREQVNGMMYPTLCYVCKKSYDEAKLTNVVAAKCMRCNHTPSRTFNWNIFTNGRYCKPCSEIVQEENIEGYGPEIRMINVINPKCIDCDDHQPSFNWSIFNKAFWCQKCSLKQIKPEEYGESIIMTNVRSTKCVCQEHQPIFGYPKDIKPTCCSLCRTDGMINIRDNLCEGPECMNKPIEQRKRPNYGHKNDGKKIYCKPCAVIKIPEEDIVNLTNPLCKHIDEETEVVCGKIADYGHPDHMRNRCSVHRIANQLRRSNFTCELCRNPAIYGINFKRVHCLDHKLDEEDLLVLQMCKGCENMMIIGSGGLCEICNPEFKKKRQTKKQNILMAAMDSVESIKKCVYSTDKIINGARDGLERPDRIYKGNDFYIVLECDEYQHCFYTKEEEMDRMRKITKSLAPLPIYFIRWNPDKYYSVEGKMVLHNKRLQTVGELIWNMLLAPPFKHSYMINIHYMYYDGYIANKWETYNPIEQITEQKIEIEEKIENLIESLNISTKD